MRKRIVVLARGDGVEASDLPMLAEFFFMGAYWYFEYLRVSVGQ